MMIKKYIIVFAATITLSGCNNELLTDTETSSDAVELTKVKASIEAGSKTRSTSDVVYLEDRISRYQFVPHDEMTFTKIERTGNIIPRFQYRDITYDNNASGAWERNKSTGYNLERDNEGNIKTDAHPERIYWSDATSDHTFVGYSLPQDNHNFDWKKSSYYYDKNGAKQSYETYYGAIGDPLVPNEVIDFNPETSTTETITITVDNVEKPFTFGYSQKLRDEDLLLTYDDALKADNSVANIRFYHGLSSVRVIVNISGFYGTVTDAYSKVSDFVLQNQPTLFRWKQQSTSVDALLTANEQETLKQADLWGSTNFPQWNQRKDMKLWNTNPDGDGEGASKIFTFYGITVPQDDDYFATFTGDEYKKLSMSFKVTYPDPMKNDPVNHTITKTYIAETNTSVKFYPGKCTTIHITLNHRDESMTVGASYQDWEYVETPDEGTLKKKDTFLSSAPSLNDRDKVGVTIVGDDKATADDATWLYNSARDDEPVAIVDIYGNNGSEAAPYTISTAKQLLSFAYEVKNGRDFTGKFVKLDADITLQPSTTLPTTTVNETQVIDYSKLVSWIGIGDNSHPFNGNFLGSGRNITLLHGKAIFSNIGEGAVIRDLNIGNAIRVTDHGALAEENSGSILSCRVEGDVENSTSEYVGSICGTNHNTGSIIACIHDGGVEGTNANAKVGGLLGRNEGIIAVSYHTGAIKGKQTYGVEERAYDGSKVYNCFYNSTLAKPTHSVDPEHVLPRTLSHMQSKAFVDELNNAINNMTEVEFGTIISIVKQYEFKFTPGTYPRIERK